MHYHLSNAALITIFIPHLSHLFHRDRVYQHTWVSSLLESLYKIYGKVLFLLSFSSFPPLHVYGKTHYISFLTISKTFDLFPTKRTSELHISLYQYISYIHTHVCVPDACSSSSICKLCYVFTP